MANRIDILNRKIAKARKENNYCKIQQLMQEINSLVAKPRRMTLKNAVSPDQLKDAVVTLLRAVVMADLCYGVAMGSRVELSKYGITIDIVEELAGISKRLQKVVSSVDYTSDITFSERYADMIERIENATMYNFENVINKELTDFVKPKTK